VPNRNLSVRELADVFAPLLADVRSRLVLLAGGDDALHWALRRKLAKELTYDERSKPMQRRALKGRKRKAQEGLCTECRSALPLSGAVLDRLNAMDGYTDGNTRLICPGCDVRIQMEKRYT
jgi:ribosomal protein L44E